MISDGLRAFPAHAQRIAKADGKADEDWYRVLSQIYRVVVQLKGVSNTGGVVPPGGATGQVLAKTSGADFATEWETITPALIGAATATQGALADSAVQPGDLAAVATSGAYSDLSGAPALAAVATSGAYSDLTGAPSLATVATTGAYSDLSGLPTLGSLAALSTINDGNWSGTDLAVANGGTGASDASGARANLGAQAALATGWTAYSPTVTAQAGTITTSSAVGAYYDIGTLRYVDFTATITTNGTGSGLVYVSLPSAPAADFNNGIGREIAVAGFMCGGFGFSGAATVRTFKLNDFTYPGGDGHQINMQVVYRTA